MTMLDGYNYASALKDIECRLGRLGLIEKLQLNTRTQETLVEFTRARVKVALKAQALAKLTKEEIQALYY